MRAAVERYKLDQSIDRRADILSEYTLYNIIISWILDEFEQLKVPMRLISAYPFRGIWCNAGWLSVWECATMLDWIKAGKSTADD